MFIHGAGGIGQSYAGSCGDAPGNKYFDPAILHNGKFEMTKGYCTDVFFGQALKWIALQSAARKPFFAYVTPNAPHAPLVVPAEYERLYAGQVPTNTAKFFGMIANIDDNVRKLLDKLKELGIERETLVIFMNDNGGTVGVPVFNAGMRGSKGSPWLGGTRAASFWRWPGTLAAGDVDALAAHIDVLPTLAEIAGVKLSEAVAQQVEGRSLVPLLKDPKAAWPDRTLVTHVGRWERGRAGESEFLQCSIRNTQWQLVCDTKDGPQQWQLFDLRADPGETNDVAAANPDVANGLSAAYDQWWISMLPGLENENAIGPKENTFKKLYVEQFGAGPAEVNSK
jgi:arylsulfatase